MWILLWQLDICDTHFVTNSGILPQEGKLIYLSMMAGVAEDVARVLAQAAQRAERHAVLNSALTQMQRLHNFPWSPEMLPWGSAMSKSYFLRP